LEAPTEEPAPTEVPVEVEPAPLRADFPPVRFPRLDLPLAGAEPRGLEEEHSAAGLPWPEEPKVSVVLYNHNDSDRLWNFMFALKSQTRIPDEILLVDNCSSDASVEFVRTNYPDVRVMELQEVFPKDQAWNLGYLAATGDLVALMDISLAFPPEWLRRAVETFKGRAAQAGVALCPVVGPQGVEAAPIYNVLGRRVGAEAPYPGGEPFAIPLGAVLMKRRLFNEGPFEEELPEGPDPFATGWRLRVMGSSAVWAFEARVLRPVDSIPPPVSQFRNDFVAERQRGCAFWALAETSTKLKILPLWISESVVRPFRRWFHPEGSFWGTLFGMLAVIYDVGGLGKARINMKENRALGDRVVTKHLSSRIAVGNGILAGLWNAFCAAYLAAVGLPTRETVETLGDKTQAPSA
jgi:glycosyltransferase involved in cell wall biosynthesis